MVARLRDLLSRTYVGAELVGVAPEEPVLPLVGHVAWVVGHIISMHVLTRDPYAVILNDEARATDVLEFSGQAGFMFALQSRIVRAYKARHPGWATLPLFENLFEQALTGLPDLPYAVGTWDLEQFQAFRGQLGRDLSASPLRVATPHQQHARTDPTAYMWWFFTVGEHPAEATWAVLRNPAALVGVLQYPDLLYYAECRQAVVHVHGVIRMMIAVTQHYINTRFAGLAGFNIEPVKTGPLACLQYIDNQRMGNFVCWPDDGVIETIKHSSCEFQRRVAGNSGRDWAVVLHTALREGVPWYSMKRQIPFQAASRRTDSRVESRRHALPRRPHWPIIDLIRTDPEYAEAVQAAIDDFGHNSVRVTADRFRRWAGQPVIVCRDRDDRLSAYAEIGRLQLCVARVITLERA
jgi:hypothetical protein